MQVTFKYDPARETFPLQFSLGSQNNPNPTKFALEVQAAGIDISDTDSVSRFCQDKIHQAGIDMAARIAEISKAWLSVQTQAERRFQKVFQTDFDLGSITGYLTLNQRCPYSIKGRFFFVRSDTPQPIQICLHELMHFYAHQLFEKDFSPTPIFTSFNDFKESLTVLLNTEFADLIDGPDKGYPQHQEMRQYILDSWAKLQSTYKLI